MRKALKFYAEQRNYIDGVPMLTDSDSGLMDTADDGHTAQNALRLLDYIGTPVVGNTSEEGNSAAA